MSSAEAARGGKKTPRVLCAGIIVLDEVFQVEEFPPPDGKVQAKNFFAVNGGCAANAAVAVAQDSLGPRKTRRADGRAPPGKDDNGASRALGACARQMSLIARVLGSTVLPRPCRRSSSMRAATA